MPILKNYVMSLLSAAATAALGFISDIVLNLSQADTFIVVSTGALVTLALTLIEQRLNSDQRELRASITEEMAEKLDLFRMIEQIDDRQLRAEVFLLARRLSIGEVPSHLAAVRTPALYDKAMKTVYASNVSLTRTLLYRWDSLARFRRIVEVSAQRSKKGVIFTRTFFLSRAAIIAADGRWDERSFKTLNAQVQAGIDVRIVWAEDLELDNLPPHRRMVRDLTIFDGREAVDTTGVQVVYRSPSDRVREFLDIEQEQMKYSESFRRYTDVELVDFDQLPAGP